MAEFDEHISQAKKNLIFLQEITSIKDYWDWKVTIAFYSALHLINAHLAKKAGFHYRTHKDVENALNPTKEISITKIDEASFMAYIRLFGLSRRARYLIHQDNASISTTCFTFDKHLKRALNNLDKIMIFMNSEYSVEFDKIVISNFVEKINTLNYFYTD